jgi:uncharacterized protein (TIGR03663 family)
MVFYSRYFIHEMLLVAFSLGLIAAGWRYFQTRSIRWAAAVGCALGLMYATKETFVIQVAAMLGALVLCVLATRRADREQFALDGAWNWKHALVALGAAAVISTLFFTSFLTNASGPLDSLRTYLPWLRRAGGQSPHIHPWSFYLERLIYFREAKGPAWSEGLIVLLALIGGAAAWTGAGLGGAHRSLVRFLGAYTLLLTAGYSLIEYKTPWCLLGFLDGMILLAGVGTMVLIHACRVRAVQTAAGCVLVAAAAQLGWQAWRASYVMAADRRNPYVYAQTVPDLLRLVQRVDEIAKVSPDGSRTLLKVMVPESDYWPLPWYLRSFRQVGWWDRLPSDPYAPMMIVGAKLHAGLDDKSNKAWLMVGYYELRPKTFLELYVKDTLWEKYIASRPAGDEG